MAFVHHESQEYTKSELELFTIPATRRLPPRGNGLSNTVDMMRPIHSDIFFQDRLILNGVNLRLKLNRAKNSFCLVSSVPGANFKVVITEAILYMRKVKVASSITLGHAAALKQSTAK